MGKRQVVISTITLLLCMSGAASAYSGGSGTSGDPYQIANKPDLLQLGATPADYGKSFIMTADIDLSPRLPGGQVFTAALIGSQANPFTGTFDGAGHSISGLMITAGAEQTAVGLFGQIDGGVSNLRLDGVNVSGAADHANIGGLCGWGSNITNCQVSGTVTPGGDAEYVGGLAGVGNSIADCKVSATVTGGSSRSIGGVCGGGGGMTRCESSGSVIAGGGSFAGGVCGQGDVTNCFSSANVTGGCAGGVVGYLWGGANISNCYAMGDVSGSTAGGVCGVGWGSYIANCYATGQISGARTGGVCGDYTYAGMEGEIGGIGGCYFLDRNEPNAMYYDWGIPLTDAQMRQRSSFGGWDFAGETAHGTADIWRMSTVAPYNPVLSWQVVGGDIDGDREVVMADYAMLAAEWAQTGCADANHWCNGADIDQNGIVDMRDLAALAEHWMEGVAAGGS